jgi:hypothetical protein
MNKKFLIMISLLAIYVLVLSSCTTATAEPTVVPTEVMVEPTVAPTEVVSSEGGQVLVVTMAVMVPEPMQGKQAVK